MAARIRGAASAAASLRASSNRPDSALTTASASRLWMATWASRAPNSSTRFAASPARIWAARRVSSTSSSRDEAIRRVCATAERRRSPIRRSFR